MKNLWKLAAIGVLSTILIGAPIKGTAQIDPANVSVPALELQQADVRDALRLLFKQVGIPYSINSDVQGEVTISITSPTPFETVLRNILNQVNATYRVEGGIYTIILKPQDTGFGGGTDTTAPITTTTTTNMPQRIQIRHADPLLIIRLINAEWDPTMQPENSVIVSGGFGGGGGNGGGGGFGGGLGGGGGSGGLGGGGFGGGGGGFGGGGGGFGGGSGGGSGGFGRG
ncbi:MAG: hypothetical protein JNM85_01475 [Chthonomonas sp.]|nr:hypothetical protein [Chthonomonas sp.]